MHANQQTLEPIAYHDTLSERDIWTKHDRTIIEAGHFADWPSFYPVYRWNRYYSYSLWSLLKLKGSASLNPTVTRYADSPRFQHLPAGVTIDSDIVRIGAPVRSRRPYIAGDSDLVKSVASALIEDINEFEMEHPNHTHLILVGGKDSLNLLLLPWQSRIIAASAPPNHSLVANFIKANKLNVELIELTDQDDGLEKEVLLNCCRIGLQDCRWGSQLASISERLGRDVVIWKGQLGEQFMTHEWLPYSEFLSTSLADRLYRRAFKRFPRVAFPRRMLHFHRVSWERGGHWQGVYNALIREVTQRLVLSAYHGPRMRKVMERINLPSIRSRDLRPALGKLLKGDTVWYPDSNPGPPAWTHRLGANSVARWVEIASKYIEIRYQ